MGFVQRSAEKGLNLFNLSTPGTTATETPYKTPENAISDLLVGNVQNWLGVPKTKAEPAPEKQETAPVGLSPVMLLAIGFALYLFLE